ncbi:MAG: hypothetical protein Kow0069_34900 [Promethearchaeota archaeon]
MGNKLEDLLTRVGKKLENFYDFREVTAIAAKIHSRRWKRLEIFKTLVQEHYSMTSSWETRKRGRGREFDFAEAHFPEIFRQFVKEFWELDSRRLVHLQTLRVVPEEILFEYAYYLDDADLQAFRAYKNQFELPETLGEVVVFTFWVICSTLGRLLHSFLPENELYLSQICGVLESSKGTPTVQFIVSVRKNPRDTLFLYCLSTIYHYSLTVVEIPKETRKKLRVHADEIYKLAARTYPEAPKILAGVFYNFRERCLVLGQMTPLLDLLNFVCARVEDSIFDTEELLVKGFLVKFSFSTEKKRSILEIFRFVNQAASLSATFQSNNLAPLAKQRQLFVIYAQYLLQGGLERLTDAEQSPLFFPGVFQRAFEEMRENEPVPVDVFQAFERFILSIFTVMENPAFDALFGAIFGCKVTDLNERFFSSFRRTLNEKLLDLIAQKDIDLKHAGHDESLSFPELVDLICRFTYYLVTTVFLTELSAERSSQNFHDKLTRYRPEGVKLRVLELTMFRELPLSDNTWSDYLRTVFRREIEPLFEPVKIPSDSFFSSRGLVRLDMVYSQGIVSNFPLLERWLLHEVVLPFGRFLNEVRGELGTSKAGDSLYKRVKQALENSNRDVTEETLRSMCEILGDCLGNAQPDT